MSFRKLGAILQALAVAVPVGLLALGTAAQTVPPTASDENFIGLARDERQAWFLSSSAITRQPDGAIQTHVYQVFRDAMVMGDKAVHFTDWIMEYDCAAGTFHPVSVTFMGDEFAYAASSTFPPGPKPMAATPDNAWGYGLVCDPASVTANRRMHNRDWREIAKRFYATMQRPQADVGGS
ncbi:hypothetical protein [Phenylobacterium sp.]|uniref:hypothetical protein n=1 Tax=Phenylobacterium sp. TaxID=1871053 RepID=UPI0035658B47